MATQTSILKAKQCFMSGNYEEACLLFANALRDEPTNAVLHTNLSLCLMKLHQFEDATNEALKALELDQSSTKVWLPAGFGAILCNLQAAFLLTNCSLQIGAVLQAVNSFSLLASSTLPDAQKAEAESLRRDIDTALAGPLLPHTR